MKTEPIRAAVSLLFVTILLLSPATAVRGENWPFWRGPGRDGVSHEKDIPAKWSKTQNVAWRLPLPGRAGATPIIWENRIFLTSVDGDDLVLMCVSTEGKPFWKRVVGRGNKLVKGAEGDSASPSPSTDGKHVWAFFSNGALGCFDLDGNKVWSFNAQDRFGRFDIAFGLTSTPVLDGDRLYLQFIHSGGAKVVALDKHTGDTLWQQRRPSDAYAECEHSYASPTLYRDAQREYLLTHGADYIVAHSLKDGGELWRCGGFHPQAGYDPSLRFVASPLAVPGLIVVPSAKNGFLFGLKVDGKGNITGKPQYRHWTFDTTPDVSCPLVVDGLVYLCSKTGVLICLDRRTGQQYYQRRTHGYQHRASPIYADGKIFLTARDGHVSVVATGRKFKLLAGNDIGEDTAASPAVSDRRIYLRSFDALYAIGQAN